MLKSMTGYGRNEIVTGSKKIAVEIRSVNHRFSDYNIKVPKQYGYLEEKLRHMLSETISRGKVDVYVSIESCGEADKVVTVNRELAANYISALRSLSEEFGLDDDLTLSKLTAFSDIFRSEPKREDEDELWRMVKTAAQPALDAFVAMRTREGQRIEKDITERVAYMKAVTEEIDERSPEIVAEYREKLTAKIHELLEDHSIDESRILTEVAIFADKVAVNEEIVRLRSHFEEFLSIIKDEGAAGRRLDFLVQEINREVNTIGSKASDLSVAKKVVTLKGETEKLREQIQNIE